jgi:GT2 family glycosyltransferase
VRAESFEPPDMAPITVGVTTKNRPVSLDTCLASLRLAADLIDEVIVFDDGSSPPASETAARQPWLTKPVVFLRDEPPPGYVIGRNRLLEAASAPFMLFLDDDTRLLDRDSIAQALEMLIGDASIAAVAFAQAEADGKPWPAAMQPSLATHPCLVPTFIGFAHLMRREAFQKVGGYRTLFGFYGEEKELSLRLLEAGYFVAYIPRARVAHLADPSGRDRVRYLRHVVRSDCLGSLYNDPLPRLAWRLPAKMALYFRMRSAWQIEDPGGFLWLLRELASVLPAVWRERRPVSRRTLRRWRELQQSARTVADGPVT